ncbi:hypothetical protein NI17_024085 (plasmid) [Thermobifida halotolerans]|uniref:Uncharacterized protein n=1 Tax=Thermobifida halotolerans TaxID=483545 RepID=A0A399FU96_9ACTN|nr:hypothetical protein [Thermobifida halotolerans]UOE22294.1 hypothetical protein NI17_024085 [Thermobifida halotolerans]
MIRIVSSRRWRELGETARTHVDAAIRLQEEVNLLGRRSAERVTEARAEAVEHARTVARLESRIRELDRIVAVQAERLRRRRQAHRDTEAELERERAR